MNFSTKCVELIGQKSKPTGQETQHILAPMSFLVTALLLFALVVLVRLVLVFAGHCIRRQPSPLHVTICCPGGGVFFWWQIGAMRELLKIYELPEQVTLSGASAGALAVVLSQCGVDPATAHAVAFRLAEDAGCFRNPFGLCGRWGALVHDWLDALLPSDAAARCGRRCRVAVTRCTLLPHTDGIIAFERRDDLINALMASTHIPFFMDGRPTSRHVYRAADGEMLSWLGFMSTRALLCPTAADRPAAVVISHKQDAEFRAACWANGWSSLSTRGTEQFSGFGAAWVQREVSRGSEGAFAALAPYRRKGVTGSTTQPESPAVARGRRSPARSRRAGAYRGQ